MTQQPKTDLLTALKLREPTGNELELGLDPDPYYLRGWNDCIDRLVLRGMLAPDGWVAVLEMEDKEKLEEALKVIYDTNWDDDHSLWDGFFEKHGCQPHHVFQDTCEKYILLQKRSYQMNNEPSEIINWLIGEGNLSAAIKYIICAKLRDNNVKDLKTARRYLDQEIAKLEGLPDPDQLTMEGI